MVGGPQPGDRVIDIRRPNDVGRVMPQPANPPAEMLRVLWSNGKVGWIVKTRLAPAPADKDTAA